MIRPLRVVLPQDSLPFTAVEFQPTAIVRNTANGLNIPGNQGIAAKGTYQTSDWILTAGYNYFSLVAWVQTGPVGGTVDVMAIPIAATNPFQELDAFSFGSLISGSYYRVSAEINGVFGMKLRFQPFGDLTGTIVDVLEFQLSKK